MKPALKSQSGGKLKLPRVEHRSGRSEIRVRARRNEKLRRDGHSSRRSEGGTGRLAPLDGDGGRILIARWNCPAEDRRAVDAEHFVNIGPVEQVERVERQIESDAFADREEAGDAQIPGPQRVADVGVPRDQPNPVGHRIGISVGVAADEDGERSPRLQGNDAAQLEVPQKAVLRPGRGEVGYEAVSDVLVRIAALRDVVELVLRKVDEGREVPVVNDVRPGVVGVQIESLAEPLDYLQGQAVVDGVDDAVVVVEKASVRKLQPVRKNRFAGEQQRGPFAGAQGAVRVDPPLGVGRIARLPRALRAWDIQAISENQSVRADEEIPGADRQPSAQCPVDLQAGLMSVRKLVVVAGQPSGPGGAGGRTISSQKYSRIGPRGDDAPDRARGSAKAETGKSLDASDTPNRRRQESRRIDQIQLPASGLGPPTNHRQSYARKEARNRLLIPGNEEEGHVVAIEKQPVAGATYGLIVRRVSDARSRLNGPPILLDLIIQSRFKVVAHAVIEGQLWSQPPLILRKEAVVAVIEIVSVALSERWIEGVLPRAHIERAGVVERELPIHVVGSCESHAVKSGAHAVEAQPRGKSGPARRQRTRRARSRSERRSAGFVHIVGEINQAVEARQDDSRGSESGIYGRVKKVIRIVSEFRVMIALDPSQSVRDLEAALVNGVEYAEVVAERQVVGDIQVGLARRTWKFVVPPGPLNQKRIDQISLQRRIQRAYKRLIIDEEIAPAARRANAPAVFSVTDQ